MKTGMFLYIEKEISLEWLIDFNGISTRLELFYT